MATHSSNSCLENPMVGGAWWAQSIGSLRVGHDGATSLSLFTFMHWRRKWQPTPVFLPGESQGRGSLVDCRLWGRTESDTTEVTQQQQQQDKLRNFYYQLLLTPWGTVSDWVASTINIYFTQSWRPGNPRLGCQDGPVLVRYLFMACHWPPSYCILA